METKEQKVARLAQLKAELLSVEGTPTEVYSRIVGYYRSVRNWNVGKRAEFSKRLEYAFPNGISSESESVSENSTQSEELKLQDKANSDTSFASYLMFTREHCPNCPPVKEYMSMVKLPGRNIDVDTAEGIEIARKYEVMSTPTVIFLDKNNEEVIRTHSKNHLEQLFARELPFDEVVTA